MNYGLENFQYFIDFRKVVQILIIKRISISLSIFQSKRSKSLSKKAAESFNFPFLCDNVIFV